MLFSLYAAKCSFCSIHAFNWGGTSSAYLPLRFHLTALLFPPRRIFCSSCLVIRIPSSLLPMSIFPSLLPSLFFNYSSSLFLSSSTSLLLSVTLWRCTQTASPPYRLCRCLCPFYLFTMFLVVHKQLNHRPSLTFSSLPI